LCFAYEEHRFLDVTHATDVGVVLFHPTSPPSLAANRLCNSSTSYFLAALAISGYYLIAQFNCYVATPATLSMSASRLKHIKIEDFSDGALINSGIYGLRAGKECVLKNGTRSMVMFTSISDNS
jgi:hypothetical protein